MHLQFDFPLNMLQPRDHFHLCLFYLKANVCAYCICMCVSITISSSNSLKLSRMSLDKIDWVYMCVCVLCLTISRCIVNFITRHLQTLIPLSEHTILKSMTQCKCFPCREVFGMEASHCLISRKEDAEGICTVDEFSVVVIVLETTKMVQLKLNNKHV